MPDTRVVVSPAELNTSPYSSVVAIDSFFPFGRPGQQVGSGTGIAVAPNYFLTAGHVLFNPKTKEISSKGRVTSSNVVPSLASRKSFFDIPPNFDIKDVTFLKGFDKFVYSSAYSPNRVTDELISKDIALVRTGGSTSPPSTNISSSIGLIAFVDERSAKGLSFFTAGYPGDFPGGKTLIASPSVLSPFVQSSYVQSINPPSSGRLIGTTFLAGQSGSGVMTRLDNDDLRVFGVFSASPDETAVNPKNTALAHIINTDTYTKIIKKIADDSGTADGNTLPENAIIGSDGFVSSSLSISRGDDLIYGTYRRERIIGGRGNDRLFGGGGDDQLEGGEGIDVARFSDKLKNYFIRYNLRNNSFDVTHIAGSKSDAKDTLKGIEYAIFEYTDNDNDGKDDDGKVQG